ncbi:hypothetical protein BDR07DRAFT_1364145, partial [Suillus spraguei]
MIFLLRAVLFCIPFVRASLSGLNDTCIHALDASNCPSCNARTLWDIVSSCGLTLFACTWTAVHPDIPYMDQWAIGNAFRRLILMIVAFILPEAIVTLAALQFISARQVAKDFNNVFGTQRTRHRAMWQNPSELAVTLLGDIPISNRGSSAKWTLTHGFFAQMGGFVLYVDGELRATLTPEELLQFVCEGSVEMPVITKADIEDRSKGDILSKCIAILQIVWFLIQLIARYTQNLPATLLEIDTLGVAALTCISYGLWLRKPKDVGRPYIVHWNSEVTAPPPGKSLDDDRFISVVRRSPVVDPFLICIGGSIRDPSFSYLSMITTMIGSISGVAFGVIHCLAWNFLFMRHTEQILWHVASAAMASLLMVAFIISMLSMLWTCGAWLCDEFELEDTDFTWGTWKKAWEDPSPLQRVIIIVFAVLGRLLYTGIIYLYFFSRVTIIVLMFLNLRSLPPGAYDTVVWTKFI